MAQSNRNLKLFAPLVFCVATAASSATLEINYQPPATGASLALSAPDPTSTPLIVELIIDGKVKTAAVLGKGLWRNKSIIADERSHPKVAQNPKSKPLPSEAEFLVPVGTKLVIWVRSHPELVGGGIGGGTVATCTTPFVFLPREGFRYIARWHWVADGCAFAVSEKALEPADAPEVPLVSLAPADAGK